MITLSRTYFTQRLEIAKERFHSLEVLVQKAKLANIDIDEIEEIEKQENIAWAQYRGAVVNLKRFDLGKMVRVEGRGYFESYKKA
jgi:hypothetical protein